MPAWCTLYKGLITLVVLLIVVEYFFGTIIETGRWEFASLTNNTLRADSNKNLDHIHSPLLKQLVSIGRRLNATTTTERTRAESTNTSHTNQTSTNNTHANASSPDVSPPSNHSTVELTFETSTDRRPQGNSTEPLLCPETPPGLGPILKVQKADPPSILELERKFSWLQLGGHWVPDSCRVLKKVALIVPYRCRAEHLLLFLQHMHPFLRKQQIDYTMFIIEQEGEGAFNRAALMNVGYVEALKIDNFDCFIFHDIDLLPEDERNLYTCPEQPRHMSVAVDIFSYKLPYTTIFGGVSAITREHFKLLNGFSNSFWGWGGEDDDMSNRIVYHNLHIARYPISIARYTMLTHKKEKANPSRYEMLKLGKQRFDTDGLSDLRYTLRQLKRNLLYTWLLVEVGPRS